MFFGLSGGEVAVILAAGFAACGPKDIPIVAKNLGRLTGRAVGHIMLIRGKLNNVVQQNEDVREVHAEVKRTMAQLDSVRNEIQSLRNVGSVLRGNLSFRSDGAFSNFKTEASNEFMSPAETSSSKLNTSSSLSSFAEQSTLRSSSPSSSPSSSLPHFISSSPHSIIDTTTEQTDLLDMDLPRGDFSAASSLREAGGNSQSKGRNSWKDISQWGSTSLQTFSGSSESYTTTSIARMDGREGEGERRKKEVETEGRVPLVIPLSARTANLIGKDVSGSYGSDILAQALVERKVAHQALKMFKNDD